MEILGVDTNKLTSMSVDDLYELQQKADELSDRIYHTIELINGDCGDCDGRDGDCACCPNY